MIVTHNNTLFDRKQNASIIVKPEKHRLIMQHIECSLQIKFKDTIGTEINR